MKVLVVEDEYYARKSIVKILSESSLNIEAVGEAESGKYAVEYLNENGPADLVITDICMEDMDGLALARYIYENDPGTKVIITTAYNKFEYAQTAIRFQVCEFIVKPIFREDLLAAVERIIYKKELNKQEEQKLLNDYTHLAIKNYVSLRTVVENDELAHAMLPHTVNNESLCFRTMVFQLEGEMKQDTVNLIEMLLRQKYSFPVYDSFYNRNNDEYVMIYSDSPEGLKWERLENILQRLINYLHICKKVSVTVGIGKVYKQIGDVYRSYKEAICAINQRLIQGWNRVYVYEKLIGTLKCYKAFREASLQDALSQKNGDDARFVVHEIIYDILENDGSVQSLYEAIISILKVLSHCFADLRSQQDSGVDQGGEVEIMFSRRHDLYHFKHLYELELYLNDIIDALCTGDENSDAGMNKIINNLLKYVESNYAEDISLKELADKKYFVNYSYLSRCFSKKTGKTFSKYLIDYRLGKAKELIQGRNMRIGHVALAVGYNDVSHFIQSFRKRYGITPDEYRSGIAE